MIDKADTNERENDGEECSTREIHKGLEFRREGSPSRYSFTDDADYHYLSAKCHAGLGMIEAARDSLNKTFALAKNLKLKALDAPLFAGVW